MAHFVVAGVIPRNFLLGLRLPSLLSNDQAWVTGHAAAERPAWYGFVLTIATAIPSMYFETAVLPCFLFFAVFFVWSLLAADRAAVTASK